MLQIAAHARLGKDPVTRETRNRNEVATVSAAVDVTRGEGDQQTLWLGAFGKASEPLMRHHKGDLLSIQGKAPQSVWTGKDGQEHSRLSVNVESIVSARTTKPGGQKKSRPDTPRNEEACSFNDPLPNSF